MGISELATPDVLYDEDGERMWVRRDLFPSHSKMRYAAFKGTNPIPVGFNEMEVDSLIELHVTVKWLSPFDTEGEVIGGWVDDGTWYLCNKNHPGAVEFWAIHAIPRISSSVDSSA